MPGSEAPLASRAVPQANQVERVVALVRDMVCGRPIELDARDQGYYAQAAGVLSLLDDDEKPTVLGRVVAGLEDDHAVRAVLREALRQSEVGKRWLAWAKVKSIEQLDPNLAEEFLRDESELAASTARRRSLTLRRWWADLCSPEAEGNGAKPPAIPKRPSSLDLGALGWDELALALGAEYSEVPLSRLELPTRMAGFAAREGLATFGDLLAFRRQDLLEQPNLGRKSIEDTRLAIVAKVEAGQGPLGLSEDAFSLEKYDDIFALLRSRCSELGPQHRLVLTHRIGIHGEAMTLEEIGLLLGVTRERVRQLESAALTQLRRDGSWLTALAKRLEDKLDEGALELQELERDRWFAGVGERQSELRFVLERLLDGRLCLVEIGPRTMLSTEPAARWEAAEAGLRSALRSAAYPLPDAAYQGLVASHTAGLPGGAVKAILQLVESELQEATGATGREWVAFGTTRGKQVLAYVHASPAPVPVRELEEKFGRGALPEAIIYVGRGLVWVAERVDGFGTWRERLTPLCIDLMAKEEPDRQWAAYELLEGLSERAQLPEWLNHWHLASMLRTSGEVEDLGRLRFRLLSQDAPERRVHARELVLAVLTEAAAPLSRDELLRRVRARGAVADVAAVGILSHLPFVQVGKDEWGLVDRDVPGGAEAFARAMEALEGALRTRGRGLSKVESLQHVRGLSATHGHWASEMVRSLARTSPVLRGAANGAVGLAEWDDVRVPNQAELLRQLVDQNQGRVAVASVVERIEELHGTRPTPTLVANLAQSVGARVRGGMVLDLELASHVSVPPPEDALDVQAIPGLPAASKPLVAELLARQVVDVAELRERIALHVERFEQASRSNEFLDLGLARQLAVGCHSLLDRLEQTSHSTAARLIAAAVEYFVTPADAEADLEIGGLDDDVAVFNALTEKVGFHDLVLKA